MAESKYDLRMLKQISQIDAMLVLKKTGSKDVLFEYAAEYAKFAGIFLDRYNDEGIIENHDAFIEDAAELRRLVERLYGTLIIWDVDELVEVFKTGDREAIDDKYAQMEIGVSALKKKIVLSECDEEGRLLYPPETDGDYRSGDDELLSQAECGKAVTGNFAPIDRLKKIHYLVHALDFDAAIDLTKRVGSVYYNETISIGVANLIRSMYMGEFEIAEVYAQTLIDEAEKYNDFIASYNLIDKKRILYVDHDTNMLFTVKGILYMAAHVCTATNHISAMRFLENCNADLIMLDVDLPDVNGFELIKRIRNIDKYKKTPAIFLTGNVSKDIILKAIDAGVSDYLRKPIDANLLIARVKKHLAV